MSEQQTPLTYEAVLEMFRQTERLIQNNAIQMAETVRIIQNNAVQMAETDRKFQETERMFQETKRMIQSVQMAETDRIIQNNAAQMAETKLMFQETDRKFQETDRKIQETSEQMKRTDQKIKKTDRQIAALGSRIGEIVEKMVAGNIVEKFQALGYDVSGCCPNKFFMNQELGIRGEVDLLLDDGPVAILIEVKTTLERADVSYHIARMAKYRQYADARGIGEKQRYIGAVAGAVVREAAAELAQENGMYVIIQSGKAVKIVTPPEGFVAKEW